MENPVEEKEQVKSSLENILQSRKAVVFFTVMLLSFFISVTDNLSEDLTKIFMTAMLSYGVGNVLAAKDNKHNFSSTKFLLTMFIIIVSTAFCYMDWMNTSLANVASTCIGTYNVARGLKNSL